VEAIDKIGFKAEGDVIEKEMAAATISTTTP
jgi:hypothetical protein